ncbi:HlyD family efflux transporter periplasmic adaptor subunit [bacterium]|nr:HlyD family efflux transporter periplasmic adaptor subunit [bacterium]
MKRNLLRLLGFASKLNASPSEDIRQTSDNDAQQLLLEPPPVWSRILIWTLGVGSISLVVWASLNTVEETAQLPGQLETIRSQVTIKSPESALIDQVNVRQHQYVNTGQLLFILDRADITPLIRTLEKKLNMIDDRNKYEERSFLSRQKQLQAQVFLNQEVFSRLQSLVDQGSASEVQLLEKQNQVFQNRQDLQNLLDERLKAESVQSIEKNDITNQIRELKQRSRKFDILSPISGTLQSLNIQAKGERVQAGDLLATIVPEEGLIASVQVSSRLSAPIKPGTSAEITVDAFPSSDYGTIEGVVTTISPTTSSPDRQATTPAYVARIALNPDSVPQNLPPDALRSGMGITASIVLEKKRTISIVFNIMQDLFAPLTERR